MIMEVETLMLRGSRVKCVSVEQAATCDICKGTTVSSYNISP